MKRPIAVVTGAGQGIGAGIARRLARDGYEVVVLEVDVPRAEAVARELDGRALACDVSDFAQVEAAAAAIGPVKVLVKQCGGPGAQAGPGVHA